MNMMNLSSGASLSVVLLVAIGIPICSGNRIKTINLSVTTDITEPVQSINEDEIKTIEVNYTLTNYAFTDNSSLRLGLCVSVEDEGIATVHSQDSMLVNLRKQPSGQFSVLVKGVFVGRTHIYQKFVFSGQNSQSPCQIQTEESAPYTLDNQFNLTNVSPPDGQTAVSFEGGVEIVVKKQRKAMDTVFNVGVVVLITIVNLGIGCKTDLGVVRTTLRRPVGPVIGFCSQFIIMPLISYGIVKAFQFGPAVSLGFFALGCSPGGSASNAYTMLLDGDVSLSITMTFISTVAALGMVPLWLLTLGPTLYSDTSIQIPYQNILYSLVGLLIPVCIGLLIRHKRPRWAKVLIKVSKGVMILFLVFVLTVGVYTNSYVFKIVTWAIVVASAAIPYTGFLLGALVAFIFRMTPKHVLTIAIETGIQNTGIAIFLLLLSLSHPESDLSIVAPILSATFTPLPLCVAIAYVQGRKRCCRRKEDEEEGSLEGIQEAIKVGEEDENEKMEMNGVMAKFKGKK